MSTVHSARWYRVADLRPRLADTLRVRRRPVRGERWVLLSDATGARSVRLNAAAWQLAARLDGLRTVQQLWDEQLARAADVPTQDEVIELLAQLREAGLLQLDRAADYAQLLPHLDRVATAGRRNTLLAWRVPLASPARLLARLDGLAHMVFSRPAFALWALAMLVLATLATQHAPTLWAHGERFLATPRYALLAALLYVPLKALHELAHGLAVRRWGGTVREAGITLMLGLPVPFVDASAATAFVPRHQRVIVGAAGMMAELAVAAVALPLWLSLPDGLARDAAFVTLFITGVSTLLFNANPLQRLDGYYILTDALDLPNLASRSRRWWDEALRRHLLRQPHLEPMPVARGERPWLVAYAPLAWLVMLGIAALAVAWLGAVSFVLGALAAVLLGWQVGLRPAVRLIASLRSSAQAQQASARRWRVASAVAAVVLALVLLVPLPQQVHTQGVVWPPERAQLRGDEDGFVAAVHANDGDAVAAGTLVLELANPRLQAEVAREAARVAALEAELFGALPGDGTAGADVRAGDARAELAAAQATLERLRQRVAALQVRTMADGRLGMPNAADLPGAYVARGRLLGHVLTDAPPTVRVALPESDAATLGAEPRPASVRLVSAPAERHTARLRRDSVGAVAQLPSAALSDRHGGPIATDPADDEALRPLQPVVVIDLELPSATGLSRLGERAWVRLDAGWSPLGWRLVRGAWRRALSAFHPAG